MSIPVDWRLVIAVGAAAGLASSPFLSPPGGWVEPVLALFLVGMAIVGRGKVSVAGLLLIGLAAVVAGLLVGAARIAAIDGAALQSKAGTTSQHGFVLEAATASRGVSRFPLLTEKGKVLVEIPVSRAPGLVPGTGIEVHGTLAPAPEWLSGELRRRGMAMVLRAESLRTDGRGRGGILGQLDRIRARAFSALSVAVPAREAALSRGFVLGDDSALDQRTVEDFRRSGLSHLMAASGQNIVLLALLAAPLLALTGLGPRARLVALAALILIYVPLAGAGPSIQRAGVMGIAALVAMAATRGASRVYALAVAAMATLALNPRASGDIGWQLSFAAVIGIMLLAGPLQERLAPLIGREGWRRALTEGIAVTSAATVATTPLTILHFERLPVASLLANLAAMPAVAPAMWAGMLGVLAGQVSPGLAGPFNIIGSVCLAWVAQVAEWFGRPGWAVAEIKLGPAGLVVLTVLLLGGSWAFLRFWKPSLSPVPARRWLPPVALLLIACSLLLPGLVADRRRQLVEPPPGGARVEILDVGQGDAILIRPSGELPLLIDGGPPGGDLPGAIQSAGVDRLAGVILTHPDLDHYGGLLDIFGSTPIRRFIFDRAPAELISAAREAGSELERTSQGDLLRSGSVSLEILWPPVDERPATYGGESEETNARSIVALLVWRGFRMLLTGDAEAEAVPIDPGPLDVLKVAHHGSEDDGLPGLLERTSPELAVIPVGAGNPFGHPVDEVVRALGEDQVPILRTDRDGTVSIVLGQGGWHVEKGR